MSEDQEVVETNENVGEAAAADAEQKTPESAPPEDASTGQDAAAAAPGEDPEEGPSSEPDDEAPCQARGTSDLPVFVCHKTVQAFKIEATESLHSGLVKLIGADSEVTVDGAYIDKHRPKVGGYFVQYHDGYRSWSPAKAFEDGYTAVFDEVEVDEPGE